MSFAALKDKAEFEYLNELPTSFVLPDEAVDRLRAAAATIIMASPEFQRLLKEVGAKVVTAPMAVQPAGSRAIRAEQPGDGGPAYVVRTCFSRHCAGVLPVQRRNARLKALTSA